MFILWEHERGLLFGFLFKHGLVNITTADSIYGPWTIIYLSGVERYFCFSNLFSKPINCNSVKTVRLLLPFLVLLPLSAQCSNLLRRWRSSGRWWDAEPTCRPGAPDNREDPKGAPSEHESGDIGNFRMPVWSAFKTAGREYCMEGINIFDRTNDTLLQLKLPCADIWI